MKKKLLALLLAVVMVVALVPTTAVSVFATTAGTGTLADSSSGSPGGSATLSTTLTYPEVAVENAVAELVNAAGEHLAYFEALDATALAYVRNGDTVKLLKDLSAGTSLTVSTPGITWTLDGTKDDESATVYTYTGTGYAFVICGAEQNVTVKGINLISADAGIQAGDGSDAVTTLVIDNVQIRCDGTAAQPAEGDTSDAHLVGDGGTSMALYNKGANSYVRVIGEKTAMQTSKGDTVSNEGFMGIYAGYFYVNDGASTVADQFATVILASGAASSTTVYGGTFVTGSTAKSVVSISTGATVSVQGGTFIYNGQDATVTPVGRGAKPIYHMFRVAETGIGYLLISGGKFYSMREGAAPIVRQTVASAYVNVSGGEFYSYNTAATIVAASQTQTFVNAQLFGAETKHYGLEIEEFYAVSSETLDDTNNAFAASELGVPATEAAASLSFTCKIKETVDYNTENQAIATGVLVYEVSDGYNETARQFYACELGRAMRAIGDGGSLSLLTNVTYTGSPAAGGARAATFAWTLSSVGKTTYTLSAEVASTYFLELGGKVKIENIVICNSVGGLIHTSSAETVVDVMGDAELFIDITESANYGIFTILGGTVNVHEDALIYCNTENATATATYFFKLTGKCELNLLEGSAVGYDANGACYEHAAVMVAVENQGAVVNCYGELPGQNNLTVNMLTGTLNVYEGAHISAKNADRTIYAPAESKNVVINVYGGKLYQPAKDASNIVRLEKISTSQDGTGNKMNIYGGTFYGSVTGGRLLWLNDGDMIIEGGLFLGTNHQIILAEYFADNIIIREGTDENGNKTVPTFYGANGQNIIDVRQNTNLEIHGGYFQANAAKATDFEAIRIYAAKVTVTGGTFINDYGNVFAVRAQSEDSSATDSRAGFVACNDVVISGGTYRYKTRFFDLRGAVTAGELRNILIEDVEVSGESHFFYMNGHGNVTFRNVKASTIGPNQATWITAGSGKVTFENCEVNATLSDFLYITSNAKSIQFVINGGTYRAAKCILRSLCALNTDANGNTLPIAIFNDGEFMPYGKTVQEAGIKMTAGICVINGGYFASNGEAVVLAGAGAANNDLDIQYGYGSAEVYVNGGYFVLMDGKNASSTDAVVKAGNASTYGTVVLNGGVYINNNSKSLQTVYKQSKFSTLIVNDGVFLSGVEQAYHVYSKGSVGAGADKILGATDGAIAVDTVYHPTVTDEAGQVKYYAFAYSEPALNTIGADVLVMAVASDEMNALTFSSIYESIILEEMGDVLTYGALIATEENVTAAGGTLTVAALDAVSAEYTLLDESGFFYYVIDGIGVAVLPIDVADYDTVYYFVGYAKLTVGDADYYIYNINEMTAGVSLRALAQDSLNDMQEEADEIYAYESIVDPSQYSPYTAEEQAAFKAIVDAQVSA